MLLSFVVPDILSNYYMEVASKGDRPPVYCPDLGLAIEGLPDGYTVGQIWNDLATIMDKSGL